MFEEIRELEKDKNDDELPAVSRLRDLAIHSVFMSVCSSALAVCRTVAASERWIGIFYIPLHQIGRCYHPTNHVVMAVVGFKFFR